MAKFICRNCGNIQRSNGQTGGCISAFWGLGLIILILISLFVPILWVVVGIVLIICILDSSSVKRNYCFECKASNSIVPLGSPAGETIYKDFYKEETIDELERKEELVIENNIKSSKDIWNNYFMPVIIAIIVLFVIIALTKSRGL